MPEIMARGGASSALAPALAALACIAGCGTPGELRQAPELQRPIRAVWVTRMSYRSAEDVERIVANCADAGFNHVLFQVRGNGTVFYRSRIEPWAEQFDFADPGFDPLALAIDAAHARGIALHAWVNVMPAWQGPGEPAVEEQLYHRHPEWFWYDADGRRQPLHHAVGDRSRDWYVSLNPCLPEVRDYLVGVFRELLANYAVDGLHLDYIRFPNEPVVPGERIPDYPRDARTLALFAAATGETPTSAPAAWDRWRTDQVTALVADIRAMLHETRPGAALSASVGPVRERSLLHYQDPRQWIDAGLLDLVLPMNYTADMGMFADRLRPWADVRGIPVAPGIMVRNRSPDKVKEQIDRARAATGDFCLFSYSSLFGGRSTGSDAARELLDHLRSLATPDRGR